MCVPLRIHTEVMASWKSPLENKRYNKGIGLFGVWVRDEYGPFGAWKRDENGSFRSVEMGFG